MGDWTYGNVSVIGDLEVTATDDDGEATTIGQIVRNIVEGYLGGGDVNDDTWTLYSVQGETRCGSAEEMADELDTVLKAHPGAFAYLVSEDPYSDWLGDLFIRVPSIPERFHVECDANGRPVVGWDDIAKALAAAPDAPAAETLRRRLGGAWLDAIAELAPVRCSGRKFADRYGRMWDCREVLGRDGVCPVAHAGPAEVPA
jgi:hypothetical protein